MKKKTTKHKKSLNERIEETFSKVAFAEAGELYPRKPHEKLLKKVKANSPVCVNGETPSGLCA